MPGWSFLNAAVVKKVNDPLILWDKFATDIDLDYPTHVDMSQELAIQCGGKPTRTTTHRTRQRSRLPVLNGSSRLSKVIPRTLFVFLPSSVGGNFK
jgi:hypothetical protein